MPGPSCSNEERVTVVSNGDSYPDFVLRSYNPEPTYSAE